MWCAALVWINCICSVSLVFETMPFIFKLVFMNPQLRPVWLVKTFFYLFKNNHLGCFCHLPDTTIILGAVATYIYARKKGTPAGALRHTGVWRLSAGVLSGQAGLETQVCPLLKSLNSFFVISIIPASPFSGTLNQKKGKVKKNL